MCTQVLWRCACYFAGSGTGQPLLFGCAKQLSRFCSGPEIYTGRGSNNVEIWAFWIEQFNFRNLEVRDRKKDNNFCLPCRSKVIWSEQTTQQNVGAVRNSGHSCISGTWHMCPIQPNNCMIQLGTGHFQNRRGVPWFHRVESFLQIGISPGVGPPVCDLCGLSPEGLEFLRRFPLGLPSHWRSPELCRHSWSKKASFQRGRLLAGARSFCHLWECHLPGSWLGWLPRLRPVWLQACFLETRPSLPGHWLEWHRLVSLSWTSCWDGSGAALLCLACLARDPSTPYGHGTGLPLKCCHGIWSHWALMFANNWAGAEILGPCNDKGHARLCCARISNERFPTHDCCQNPPFAICLPKDLWLARDPPHDATTRDVPDGDPPADWIHLQWPTHTVPGTGNIQLNLHSNLGLRGMYPPRHLVEAVPACDWPFVPSSLSKVHQVLAGSTSSTSAHATVVLPEPGGPSKALMRVWRQQSSRACISAI